MNGRKDLRGGLIPLRGDASTRSFYRVPLGAASAVMLVLEEPRAEGELTYINVRSHLAACGVKVPEIYDYDAENGILLIEDFGDVSLEERLEGADEETFRHFYRRAIDEMLKIHITGSILGGGCGAFHLAFDEEKLMEELDFFIRHTVEGFFGARLDGGEREAIRRGFSAIAAELAAFPRVLSHRDYHSRNLMVMDDSVGVVDFQDARMGPCQYDLASLLRDSYVVIESPLRGKLIDYYLRRSEEEGIEWHEREEFIHRFDLMSLQRNLKACGTFGYMAVARGNDSYLKYLDPTFAYVRETAPKFTQVGECIDILARYIKQIR